MKIKARFKDKTGIQHFTPDGQLKEGDSLSDDGTIFRFQQGLLHGEKEPAVECDDGHIEYWEKGQLHRTDGPAVISDYGKFQEFWKDGKFVKLLEN